MWHFYMWYFYMNKATMKPGSVAALKEMQEKLASWSTWDETKKEWDAAILEWIEGLPTLTTKKGRISAVGVEAHRARFDRERAYASFVPWIVDTYAPEEGPKREEFIDSLEDIRRLGEALQSRNTWCSQFKIWSDVLLGILAESDPSDETP